MPKATAGPLRVSQAPSSSLSKQESFLVSSGAETVRSARTAASARDESENGSPRYSPRGVGSPVTHAFSRTSNAESNGATPFHIVVAARVRPFTQKEVQRWRAQVKQRRDPTHSSAAADGGSPAPPEPGAMDGGGGGGGTTAGAAQLPIPVMDIDNGEHTLTLLDPARPDTARAVFSFDHVYASFAPSVELLPMLTGRSPSLNGTYDGGASSTRPSSTTGAQTLVLDDAVELSSSQHEAAESEQQRIFAQLGQPLLESALRGYNACLFAYGQTGSGKTYTMLGSRAHPGVTPRLLHALFSQLDADAQRQEAENASGGASSSGAGSTHVSVEVSFMEIYKEQVRDLLKHRPKKMLPHYNSRFDRRDVDYNEYQPLKVRQHPEHGLFVDGLSAVRVHSWPECRKYLVQGSQLRTQAATSMNETSSRSHAIFQIQLTRTETLGGRVRGQAVTSQLVNKINLVDLAGSERNSSSATSSKGRKRHMAEANSINVSLSTLRRVIEALVANSSSALDGTARRRANGAATPAPVVVPYRESLLTYVLSDNFGGNSRTVMCANVSPSEYNVAETESTLRYATLARGVRNRVKLKEDPSAKVIHELQNLVQTLQSELASAPSPMRVAALELDLEERDTVLRDLRSQQDAMERDLAANAERAKELSDALAERDAEAQQWHEEHTQLREAMQQLQAENKRLADEQRRREDERVAREAALGSADEGTPLARQQATNRPRPLQLESSSSMLFAADEADEADARERAGAVVNKKKKKKKTTATSSPGARRRSSAVGVTPTQSPSHASGQRRSAAQPSPRRAGQQQQRSSAVVSPAAAVKKKKIGGQRASVGKSRIPAPPSPSRPARAKEPRVGAGAGAGAGTGGGGARYSASAGSDSRSSSVSSADVSGSESARAQPSGQLSLPALPGVGTRSAVSAPAQTREVPRQAGAEPASKRAKGRGNGAAVGGHVLSLLERYDGDGRAPPAQPEAWLDDVRVTPGADSELASTPSSEAAAAVVAAPAPETILPSIAPVRSSRDGAPGVPVLAAGSAAAAAAAMAAVAAVRRKSEKQKNEDKRSYGAGAEQCTTAHASVGTDDSPSSASRTSAHELSAVAAAMRVASGDSPPPRDGPASPGKTFQTVSDLTTRPVVP